MILHNFYLVYSLHLPAETHVTRVTYSTPIGFMLRHVTSFALFSLCIKKIPRNSLSRFITNTSPTKNLKYLQITVNHQGGPSPLGGGRNWVHFPTKCLSSCSTYLLYVLGHLRHPPGKPFDADPVRLCQTLARKGTAETRFEVVSGRSEANVPARLGPLRFVGACRLAWRSG